jgi:hypothetical protein
MEAVASEKIRAIRGSSHKPKEMKNTLATIG